MVHLSNFSLPSSFPSQLFEKGYSLEEIGFNEMAWKGKDVKRVIEFLVEEGFPILGGDVYTLKNEVFTPTYDGWFLNKDEGSSWEDFVLRSKEKALKYIDDYENNDSRSEEHTSELQ